MSRWLALADTSETFILPCDSSTNGDKTQPEGDRVGSVTFCQLSHRETNKDHRSPDNDAFEERAAIAEYDGGLSRADVLCLTTQNAELEAANARLEHMVKEFNQLVYGKKSEKLSADERQLAFEDLEIAVAEAQAQSEVVEMATPRKKRKPPQRNLGNLP